MHGQQMTNSADWRGIVISTATMEFLLAPGGVRDA